MISGNFVLEVRCPEYVPFTIFPTFSVALHIEMSGMLRNYIPLAIYLAGCLIAHSLALALPLSLQQTPRSANLQTVMAHDREKVPGDNMAYYTGPKSMEEQLFEIEEFTIAPNPPMPYANLTPRYLVIFRRLTRNDREHRFFGYLGGFMPDAPDLNETRLRLTSLKNGGEPSIIEEKFASCVWILMRHARTEYGHELKPGRMEFIMDYIMMPFGPEPGVFTFKAEANLPDGRVLFCFEFSMSVEDEG